VQTFPPFRQAIYNRGPAIIAVAAVAAFSLGPQARLAAQTYDVLITGGTVVDLAPIHI